MADYFLYDYDMFGTLDRFNNISVLTNKASLDNSVRMWFASRRGDRLRSPTLGGFLDFQITKKMSPDDLVDLEQRVRRALDTDFKGLLKVNSLTLTPLNNDRTLQVDIKYTSRELNTNTELKLNLKV